MAGLSHQAASHAQGLGTSSRPPPVIRAKVTAPTTKLIGAVEVWLGVFGETDEVGQMLVADTFHEEIRRKFANAIERLLTERYLALNRVRNRQAEVTNPSDAEQHRSTRGADYTLSTVVTAVE